MALLCVVVLCFLTLAGRIRVNVAADKDNGTVEVADGSCGNDAILSPFQLTPDNRTGDWLFDSDGFYSFGIEQDDKNEAKKKAKLMLSAIEKSVDLQLLRHKPGWEVSNLLDEDKRREEKALHLLTLYFIYVKGLDQYMYPSLLREDAPDHDDPTMVKFFAGFLFKEDCEERMWLLRTSEPSTGDVVAVSSLPEGVQAWDDFCEIIPAWGDPSKSFVFHRDDVRVKRTKEQPNCLVQRVQKSGLCYLHGPDVMQHYLVAMSTPTPVPMIDLTNYIRQTFTAEQLWNHMQKQHRGGISFRALQNMLLEGSEFIRFWPSSYYRELFEEAVVTNLKQYGPALVSNFQVRKEFFDGVGSQYLGKPGPLQKDEEDKGHAMVLIGYRQDESGRYRFLVQNWWKSKQFVEFDLDYLLGSEASLTFTTTPQDCVPKELPSRFSVFAETEVDGKDMFAQEMPTN